MVDFNIPALAQPKDTRAVLKINGRSYNAWKSINISRSIAQIAGSFSFSTANRFAGENEKWNIKEGDECTVEVADEKVITGYIDEIDDGYDLNSHDVTFSGRDKTADLVDCSYDVFTGKSELKNQTVLQIITELAGSVDVDVSLDSALLSDAGLTKTIPDQPIETGEPIYEAVSKLCQQYGVLAITTGDGKLLITRAGLNKAFDSLKVGVNIKSNRINRSNKDRYSIYYVTKGLKPNAFNSKLVSEGQLVDETITRTRPLIILVGEQNLSADVCQKRAAWEARIRAGGSRKVETTVRGWTQTNGVIWPLNGLVSMLDDKLGINDTLLIAGLNFNLDSSGGELTTMSLVHPDTFALKENVPIKKGEGLNAFGRPLK